LLQNTNFLGTNLLIGTSVPIRTWRLSIDLNLVLVERHVVLDVIRLFFGLGVVPGDVWDGFSVDGSVVVRGGSFPRTDSTGLGIGKERLLDRAGREVMIVLDHDGLVGLGDGLSVDYDFDHSSSFVAEI